MKLDELTPDFSGMEITVKRTEVVRNSKLQKLSDTYAEHAKLVFIFDVSGSMDSSISYDCKTGESGPGKMDLVKKLARQEIEKRYQKFPGSRVAVIQFGSRAETIFDDGAPDELWPALENLTAHGHLSYSTDILSGIRKAMEVCRAKPSRIGVHHFIIVGDGQDSGTYAIDSWLPALKASGVVLDYIHIGSEGSLNEPLQKACVALAGEFVTVDSEEAFEAKFIAAAERLCLPPGK